MVNREAGRILRLGGGRAVVLEANRPSIGKFNPLSQTTRLGDTSGGAATPVSQVIECFGAPLTWFRFHPSAAHRQITPSFIHSLSRHPKDQFNNALSNT